MPAKPPNHPASERQRLRQLENDFRRDPNPVHALEAFLIAHRSGIDLPNWSLEQIAASVERVMKALDEVACGSAIGRDAEYVGKAFRFGREGRGRGGQLKHAAMLKRDRDIYFQIRNEIEQGTKLDFAYDTVAKAMDVSRSTVVRAYRRIPKLNSSADR